MAVEIRLLGKPAIIDSGEEQPVRGLQAWALLARILLSKQPIDRRDIALELFPDAVDPLGSLRWCLASIRRALKSADAVSGDPIQANLPPGATFDWKTRTLRWTPAGNQAGIYSDVRITASDGANDLGERPASSQAHEPQLHPLT